MWRDQLLESNKVPDFMIRRAIRGLLKQRLTYTQTESLNQQQYLTEFVEQLKHSPIAVNTLEANEQHYEVPTRFFQYVLGEHLKYSSGYWDNKAFETNRLALNHSEEVMLQLTCQRAQLQDGQRILELGCGWGSLSLYMAAHYPNSPITVVSNSATQKTYIDQAAKSRGLINLTVVTADMNDFQTEESFDRVASVEMFEHMQNYQKLLDKISHFLKPEGKLFVHIFTHKDHPYLFEIKDDSDWMAKYFFTGGMMPSANLLLYFAEHLYIEQQWQVNGTHYQKTCEAWLSEMDLHRSEIMPLFVQTYGQQNARKWWVYWRVFFMSCAELFGYNQGHEWFVSHYLFTKR